MQRDPGNSLQHTKNQAQGHSGRMHTIFSKRCHTNLAICTTCSTGSSHSNCFPGNMATRVCMHCDNTAKRPGGGVVMGGERGPGLKEHRRAQREFSNRKMMSDSSSLGLSTTRGRKRNARMCECIRGWRGREMWRHSSTLH